MEQSNREQRLSGSELELENTWEMWVDSGNNQQNLQNAQEWSNSLLKLCSVQTIGEFWILFDSIPRPSAIIRALSSGQNLYFFKRGIEPVWESPANRNGGRWSLVLSHTNLNSPPLWQIDDLWLNTLLACIGEQMGDGICGCCLNLKPSHQRIAIWISNSTREQTLSVGQEWKEALQIPETCPVNFQKHGESTSPRMRVLSY